MWMRATHHDTRQYEEERKGQARRPERVGKNIDRIDRDNPAETKDLQNGIFFAVDNAVDTRGGGR